MIQQQGLEAMEVKSDSTATIDLINGEPHENSPHTVLVKECKALMEATRCNLGYTLREGNNVTDRIVKCSCQTYLTTFT